MWIQEENKEIKKKILLETTHLEFLFAFCRKKNNKWINSNLSTLTHQKKKKHPPQKKTKTNE